MQIAVCSDAHGSRRRMDAMLQKLPDIDALCFLGDMDADASYLSYGLAEKKPHAAFHAVCGNNDLFSVLPKTLSLWLGGIHVLLTHGHLFRIKERTDLLVKHAVRCGCTLVLYGHTHIPKDARNGSIHLVNPGALMLGEWCLLELGPDHVQVMPQHT